MDGDLQAIAMDEGISPASTEGAGAWLFWPATIRVHRLTSITRDDSGAPAVDLRVEALDRLGESTRAVGTFVVELSAVGADPVTTRWRVEIGSLEAHRARFDPVTDTYRFEIAPSWRRPPEAGSALALRVILFAADGSMLEATANLRWP